MRFEVCSVVVDWTLKGCEDVDTKFPETLSPKP